MAKKKEKGFNLGKSNEPTPGFELNKKSGEDAPSNAGEGFALGKGKDEKTPTFDLGKSEQGTAGTSSKKVKGSKEVSLSDNATSLKNKGAEKASKVKVQNAPVKADSIPLNEGSSTSTSNDALVSSKRSKAPMLIGVLAVVLIGLYFFIPASVDDETMQDFPVLENATSQDDESMQDNSVLEDGASQTENQFEEPSEGSESNLSSIEEDVESEILEVTSEDVNAAAVSTSSNLGSFSFGQNSTSVSISENQLNDLLAYLDANSSNSIVIEGHSSSEGDDYYNIGLSRRRAESVKAEFVRNGLSSDRILTVAKGSEFPIADNTTEPGRAKNRRVEIKFK